MLPAVNVVVISRLVYRKGTDLLVQVIPAVCKRFPNVRFIVGGDGPKRIDLEQMKEQHGLQERIELLGPLPHDRVRETLTRGHIFLNTSLTEAFCIAIVEAACCGLLVVSTKVGGIPEVLPSDMIFLCETTVWDIVSKLSGAIKHILVQPVDSVAFHTRIKSMYSWENVAERTEKVYFAATTHTSRTMAERLRRTYKIGPVAGKLFCLGLLLEYATFLLLSAVFSWRTPPNYPPDVLHMKRRVRCD